jgi:hypothetical protein
LAKNIYFRLDNAVLSITTLYIWDRVPAARVHRFLTNLNDECVAGKAAFKQDVLGTGFLLAYFANFLTVFRVITCTALFILSVLVVRRYLAISTAIRTVMLMRGSNQQSAILVYEICRFEQL